MWNISCTGETAGVVLTRLKGKRCDCAVIHPLYGVVSTYHPYLHDLQLASDINDRVLLHNPGGIARRHEWQVVPSVSIMRGYYVLVDFREQAVISMVEKL